MPAHQDPTSFVAACVDGIKTAHLLKLQKEGWRRLPTRNLRRIEPGPRAFVRTCPDCSSDLTDRMQDSDGQPTYCDECDRNHREWTTRDARPELVAEAINALKHAREVLTEAGASAALDYVRRALKSAEGAERHAIARRQRGD